MGHDSRDPGGRHAAYPSSVPLRPLRRRVGPARTAVGLLRGAGASPEMARPAGRGRRLLTAPFGLRLADAAQGGPAPAEGLLTPLEGAPGMEEHTTELPSRQYL